MRLHCRCCLTRPILAPGDTFTVRNTGKRAGAEVAQVYAGLPTAANEPPKRLAAWEKVQLAPARRRRLLLRSSRSTFPSSTSRRTTGNCWRGNTRYLWAVPPTHAADCLSAPLALIGAGNSSLSDLYNGNRVGIQFDGKVLGVIQGARNRDDRIRLPERSGVRQPGRDRVQGG